MLLSIYLITTLVPVILWQRIIYIFQWTRYWLSLWWYKGSMSKPLHLVCIVVITNTYIMFWSFLWTHAMQFKGHSVCVIADIFNNFRLLFNQKYSSSWTLNLFPACAIIKLSATLKLSCKSNYAGSKRHVVMEQNDVSCQCLPTDTSLPSTFYILQSERKMYNYMPLCTIFARANSITQVWTLFSVDESCLGYGLFFHAYINRRQITSPGVVMGIEKNHAGTR